MSAGSSGSCPQCLSFCHPCSLGGGLSESCTPMTFALIPDPQCDRVGPRSLEARQARPGCDSVGNQANQLTGLGPRHLSLP